MNTSTHSSLSAIATSLWDDFSLMGERVETDMKTLTEALCLSNDPSGLQTLFDKAFEAANSADKTARGAVTSRWTLLAKRAHYWAGQSGFALALPRLDNKGAVKVPSVTPKEVAKAEAQGAAAERAAAAEQALADMAQRNSDRNAAAVKALTPTDIAASVLALCDGSGIWPLEVVLALLDSIRPADLDSLAGVVANMVAVRDWDRDARYQARNPGPALPDDAALPDVSPAPSKANRRRQA